MRYAELDNKAFSITGLHTPTLYYRASDVYEVHATASFAANSLKGVLPEKAAKAYFSLLRLVVRVGFYLTVSISAFVLFPHLVFAG
ncbi:hypothetical protein ACLOJK_039516 [Asimina triloba]